MNRLDRHFKAQKEQGNGVLITYFPLGEPRYDTLDLVRTYMDNGVDLLEIGLPVDDPFFDGQVVSDSMKRVREAGRDIDWMFAEIARIRAAYPDIPLQAFSYKQIFEQKPMREFVACCERAGVDAILISDGDEEQLRELESLLPPSIHLLHFMPFGCPPEKVEAVRAKAKGYIFLQAADGVTGERNDVDPALAGKTAMLHEALPSETAVCVGFGISAPEHCRAAMEMGADGVIVGSMVVKTLHETSLAETGELFRRLKAGLRRR